MLPVPLPLPVAPLAFSLARSAAASSFSRSSISICFSNSQSPIFPFISFFRPPGPAPAFFPAYFERILAVSISAISALAIAASVCRESLRMSYHAVRLQARPREDVNCSVRLVAELVAILQCLPGQELRRGVDLRAPDMSSIALFLPQLSKKWL